MKTNSIFKIVILVSFTFNLGAFEGGGENTKFDKESPEIRFDLNGKIVKDPNYEALFLIDKGCRRYINDLIISKNFFKELDFYEGKDVELIKKCHPLGKQVVLASCERQNIWLIDKAEKRLVRGLEIMDKYNFNWERIENWSCLELDLIGVGDPLK